MCLVTNTNTNAVNPMLAMAKIKPKTFLTIASGLILFMLCRSCIVILGEFPAYALGYLSGFGEIRITIIRLHSAA